MKLKNSLRNLMLMQMLGLPLPLFAVNGAFDYGFSEITRGMGGAGSALPQDTIIAAVNPAGMVWQKHIMDIGLMTYFPKVYWDASNVLPNAPGQIILTPGRHASNLDIFTLPDLGLNMPVGKSSTFGATLYSIGGFGSSYPGFGLTQVTVPISRFSPLFATLNTPGPFGGGFLHSDLKQAVGAFTLSSKFSETSSWGLSLLIGLQQLALQGAGLLRTFSMYPWEVTNRANAFSAGIGTRGGVLIGAIPHVKLSASYQPKILMSNFRQYRGILADNGSFDIPATGVVGVAVDLPLNLILAFDVQRIWFSDIKAYGHPHDAVLPGGTCSIPGFVNNDCYGGPNGPGFGWKNLTAYKVGVQWQFKPDFAIRFGYNHANSVLQAAYLAENVVAPGAVIEDIYTAGFSKKIGAKSQLNAVLAYVPPQSKNGTNAFSTTAVQAVTIRARGWGFGASYSVLFS